MPRLLRLSLRILLVVLALVLLAALAGWLAVRASLPQLEGSHATPGLSRTVSVERDALGSVTIEAGDALDAMQALGFVHAQERYFEMDLMRRSAAGELAALFGARAVPVDQRIRVHRMRHRAREFTAAAPEHERDLLRAYTEGVNAGLDALRARPWAYLLLRTPPEPWREEDTLLVGYAMFFDLHGSGNRREHAFVQARRHLPEELVAVLAADGSSWDASLMGEARAGLDEERLAALAAARDGALADAAGPMAVEDDEVPGSNNFAVSGALTDDGRALVADDMHLGLRAPNIWFRAHLRYPDAEAPGGRVDVGGVSLPGLPGIVVGSSGHVAWGFTNAFGDWQDFIRVHWLDEERSRYRVPGGEATATRTIETIEVAGGDPVPIEVLETRWGPVWHEDVDGSSLALAWTAHRAGSLDLGVLDLTRAADIDEAMAIAARAGIPPQNFVVGDRGGRVGWSIIGRIPKRTGDCDPLAPLDPVLEGCDWDGWIDPARTPRLADPDEHRVWTANSRVADGEALELIGDGGYDLGARQRQIRDLLFARERFTEQDLLDIQIDDRALFLEPWWQLLRDVIEEAEGAHPALAALDAPTREWEGSAGTDAVAYRLVRGFRGEVVDRLAGELMAPVREAEGEAFIAPRLSQFEALAWPLASQRPPGWEPQAHGGDWMRLFEDAAASLVETLGGAQELHQRTWGERNTAVIAHPLAAALPGPLARALSMPAQPLPGDSNMPRAQGPNFGASQRMVVAPGHEARGILHMPGGQSGHPLSPFWGSGHESWATGAPTPFLPGPPEHRLLLVPLSEM